ncbi:MAG: dienelactone hydrolase family protein [Planctomycetaceae bacterium]|nr:dienelactone hydrolase family protein [Planctomycetaceae bacterium]
MHSPRACFRLITLLLLLAPFGRGAVDAAEPIVDAKSLWQGVDVHSLPLDVESLSRWSDDTGAYEKLRFTSEVAEGTAARVFAIRGAPLPTTGQSPPRVPGILHIHGGGQTASLDWVRFWVERGYTCLTFDFCGPWADRQEVTNWGPIQHANMAQAAGGFQVHPTPRESSWFHWALACRRALTVLSEHPQTDSARLGIFGISMGGTLCWLVAASDERVKTAVPIYGCGYNHDDRRERFGFGKLSDDLQLYKRTLSPEAHAPQIQVPIFFLNATNDFHGPLDFGFDTLGAVRGPTRWAFTPRTNHHIASREARDLPLWMDWQLRGGPAWPASPEIVLDLDHDGIPRATVRADQPDEVTAVQVLYSLGDRLPAARYWRRAFAGDESARRYLLPVMSIDEPLWAIANVSYRSGVTLSSNMPMVLPREIKTDAGPARATLAWTSELADRPGDYDSWYFTAGATDPNREVVYLATEREGDVPYLTHEAKTFPHGGPVQFSSHLIGDPQHIGRPGDELAFEVRGDLGEQGLTVRVYENDWSPLAKKYEAKALAPTAGEPPQEVAASVHAWRKVRLAASEFHAEDGTQLQDWSKVQRLEVAGNTQGRAGFRKFRFVAP